MGDEKHTGWYKMHRSILDGPVWNMGEPFGKRDAYIDLLLLANYYDEPFIPNHSNDVITIRAGQRLTSYNSLAKRWGWDKKRVENYLNQLEKAGIITKKSYNFGTLITLLEYGHKGNDDTTSATASATANGTPVHTANATANGERIKKDKNSTKKVNNPTRKKQSAKRPQDCFCWEGEPE